MCPRAVSVGPVYLLIGAPLQLIIFLWVYGFTIRAPKV